MFFDRRNDYNGEVADLLRGLGIDVEDSPMGILAVLDHAWLNRYSAHEGALLVAYSHATALYKQDASQADAFTMSRLYPLQLDWLKNGLVRPEIVEPMTRLLKQRAYDSYEKRGSTNEVNSDRSNPEHIQRSQREPVTVRTRQKLWILNKANGQLIRRDTGKTFDVGSYIRESGGFVIRDKEYPWASNCDVEEIG